MKENDNFDLKQKDKKVQIVKIPTDVLNDSDSIELDLEMNASETKMVVGRNSRCVSVDTFLFAPLGRKEKKECLRGNVTSLNLDVLFTKRSYSKLKQPAVDLGPNIETLEKRISLLIKKRINGMIAIMKDIEKNQIKPTVAMLQSLFEQPEPPNRKLMVEKNDPYKKKQVRFREIKNPNID